MKGIEDRCLARHEFHGEWNYACCPSPAPPRTRSRARPAAPHGPDLHALADPAITGMPRARSGALTTRLEIPLGHRPGAAPVRRPARARAARATTVPPPRSLPGPACWPPSAATASA